MKRCLSSSPVSSELRKNKRPRMPLKIDRHIIICLVGVAASARAICRAMFCKSCIVSNPERRSSSDGAVDTAAEGPSIVSGCQGGTETLNRRVMRVTHVGLGGPYAAKSVICPEVELIRSRTCQYAATTGDSMAIGCAQPAPADANAQTGAYVYPVGSRLAIGADSGSRKGRTCISLQRQTTSQFSAIGKVKGMVSEGIGLT